jgi:hypothetical protein
VLTERGRRLAPVLDVLSGWHTPPA